MTDLLLLTVDDAALLLSLRPRHVARLAKAKAIPSVRIGRRYLIPRVELEAWIAGVKQRLGAPRIATKKS